MPDFVTVTFNKIHEDEVRRAKYDHNEFVGEPKEFEDYPERMGLILKCPEGRGQYQADRYTSFLKFGSMVWPDLETAEVFLADY